MIELKAIRGLAVDGVSGGEIERVKEHLERAQNLEAGFEATVPWVDVTIGGQVQKPGRHTVPLGTNLYSAV